MILIGTLQLPAFICDGLFGEFDRSDRAPVGKGRAPAGVLAGAGIRTLRITPSGGRGLGFISQNGRLVLKSAQPVLQNARLVLQNG